MISFFAFLEERQKASSLFEEDDMGNNASNRDVNKVMSKNHEDPVNPWPRPDIGTKVLIIMVTYEISKESRQFVSRQGRPVKYDFDFKHPSFLAS